MSMTLFEKAVSSLIELLLHETNQYANRDKNKPQFKVTLEGLEESDYRGVVSDLRCDTFCETMSRNRFFEIKSFFNAAYNQSLSEPYMAKVEPLHMIF